MAALRRNRATLFAAAAVALSLLLLLAASPALAAPKPAPVPSTCTDIPFKGVDCKKQVRERVFFLEQLKKTEKARLLACFREREAKTKPWTNQR